MRKKKNIVLCNDGQEHPVALEIRHCGDESCPNLMGGQCPGRYVYAVYKTCGKVRRDYVGKVTPSRGDKCRKSIQSLAPLRAAEKYFPLNRHEPASRT